jgi:PAS domain S-box-containing protein
VTTTSSADIALSLLKSNGIQAIVSDYQMPGMDGIEFLKQVRATDKHTPFILFTGKGREEIAIEAFENGADFYVQKGGDPTSQFAELIHKVHAAVDRCNADLQVIRANRLYNVLSATNRAIVRIYNKKELLNEICRIAVSIGGFRMAWAGLANPGKHIIEPIAAFGHIDNYLETIAISTNDTPRGRGPTGTAFRERKFNFSNDIANDPKMAPWREAALERGYRSLAAFPFAINTRNAGVITFYASEQGFFNDQTIRLLDEQSHDISFALVTLDHEEQRITAEKNLKTSELQYRRLFETAQDAILILDGDSGEVIDANKFILDLLGYPLEYFVGRHLWELGFLKDKSIAKHAFDTLKTDGYIRYEDIPLEAHDGRSIDVEFISNSYLVGDKKIIQCNIRDTTARIRIQDALVLAGKKMSLLSSITRHDINNQLTVLRGYLNMLEISKLNPTQIEYFQKITNAAERISAIIRFTKEYEEIGVHDPTWQDIPSLVEIAGRELHLGKVTVKNDLPTGTEVFADQLIGRVFFNLIDNAVRYGRKITTIRFSAEKSGDILLILCEDDGDGVPTEEKEKIFGRGYGKNTGMGLFLSREILDITGITIHETGEPGKGARFEIKVPKGAFRYRSQF